MKSVLKIIVLLLLVSSSLTAEDDDFNNKLEHVALHGFISAVTANIAYDNGFSKTESWWIGFGTSVLIGFAWEMSNKNFGNEDFASDIVGAGLGSSSLFVIHF